MEKTIIGIEINDLFADLRVISDKFEHQTNKPSSTVTRDFYRSHSEYKEKYRTFFNTFSDFRSACFPYYNELNEVKDTKENSQFNINTEIEGPNLNIVSRSSELRTLDQLLAYCNVDLDRYGIVKHTINSWGSETNENFQVKAWLKEKIETVDPRQEYQELIEDAKEYMPKYKSINFTKNKKKEENLLEISLFDHHFGQLAWGEETGYSSYDIKVASSLAIDTFNYILDRGKSYEIDRILLPIGNDFFNVNNASETTVKGTFQAEDDRWKKTFRNGRKLWVDLIEMCMQIAPVDALVIPGNHDAERVYYLGDALECWFNQCDNVNVNNTAKNRKYYQWGKNLIMFTHGSEEVKNNLINLMPIEEPLKWSQSTYREIHKGHYHSAKQTAFQLLNEVQGVREWVLPSLVSVDDWHSRKGYSALRETIAMLWNKEKGKTEMIFYHP